MAEPLPSPTEPGPLLPWLLVALASASRSRIKEWLRDGRFSVNGAAVTRHDFPVAPGDKIAFGPPTTVRADSMLTKAGVRVLRDDPDFLVIDKPAGLLTVATAAEKHVTAFALLSADLAARNAGRPFVVHRLDRETSGLLLFARSPEIRDRLQASWDAVEKTYLAVTERVPEPPAGVVDNFLREAPDLTVRRCGPDSPGAKRAVSEYRTLAVQGQNALVEVRLITGRKHQIRVHLARLGSPIVGDTVYNARTSPAGRLGLHAHRLTFPHPTTGDRVEVESPLPDRLRKVVDGNGRR